jgi:hypothetical protein
MIRTRRVCGERPLNCRTAKKCYELVPPHCRPATWLSGTTDTRDDVRKLRIDQFVTVDRPVTQGIRHPFEGFHRMA